MRKQRTSDYYSSDTEHITSEDIDVSGAMAVDFQDIFVMRPQMQTNIGGSFKEAKQLYDNGDDEVRQLLLKECRLIYECKKCRNMFRSLTQFIGHKRVFCRNLVCNNDGDIAGGDNFNGFHSNHVMAAKKKVSSEPNEKCESVVSENDVDNASVRQTRTLCESNKLRDEKITGEIAVPVPPPEEQHEVETVQNILSCPQERCTLSFSNTKDLEKHFSEDHTNAIVFPTPVAQTPEPPIQSTTEPIIEQIRAKRILSNNYQTCEHCRKVFERKEALNAHLMHCPVKHNILSKTLAAGISDTMLAKRIKLQMSPEVTAEATKTSVKATNECKENEVANSDMLKQKPQQVKDVVTKINNAAPGLKHAINIKQEYVPQESSILPTIDTNTLVKKKRKNRRLFMAKISRSFDEPSNNECMPKIKEENGNEITRKIAKVKSEYSATNDESESEPKKLLSTCTYCSQSFERRAALSTHLQHCEVKNSMLDRTTIYGMSSSAKRTKLFSTMEKASKDNTRPPSFTSTPVEDPETELLNEMFANLGRQSFGVGLRTVEIDQDDLSGSGTDDAKEDEEEEEEEERAQVNTQNGDVYTSLVEQNVTKEENTHDTSTEANEEDTDKKARRMRSVPAEKRLLCRCKICNKQFTALSNVRRHISMFHYRSQRFGCTLCEYRAFRRYDIVNHLGNSHGMTGDPETMSIEFVSEHEVKNTKEDVDGDIVVLEGKSSEAHVASTITENVENGNENAQTAKRAKRSKTTTAVAGVPTVTSGKITRQKLKSSQTQMEASISSGGKTPMIRRPIRNRIKAENKDFVYDLSSLVKKDNNVAGAQNEAATTRTLRRRNTMNNGSVAASNHGIDSLLGPADSRDHIRGAAQRLVATIIRSGAAASATQPELPTERPQMRSRLFAAQRPESNPVTVIEGSQLEAARLQSTLLDDTFLEKVTKTSTTSFKIKPSFSLHTSTLNWLLEKVDSSKNGKSSPSSTLCSADTVIKSLHVSPPPSIPRAVAPPPTPRKRITMMERLRDDKLKYRDTLLRSALQN